MRPTSLALMLAILLAAWGGAVILTSVVVAPAAFAVLPSRTLAGALVGHVLPVIFWSGIALGLLAMGSGRALNAGVVHAVSAIVLAGSCAVAQLVIAPRLERIRAAIGGAVDVLDAADPRRQAFGRLHGLSVLCLGVGGLAALVVLIVITRLVAARSAA